MQTSLPGNARAFTLLEVLVVLTIVGLTLSLAVAVLSPSPARIAGQEAERLALALEAATEEALGTGQSLAWSFDTAGYRFARREAGAWQPWDADGLLPPRPAKDWRIRAARLGDTDLPSARWAPLGPGRPMQVELAAGPSRWRVLLDGSGQGRAEALP
ncbi:GspH/FimT family pseudopilin [Denitratisoma oestradiolicum]|uniref:Type II secretion system protein H n=1 Tax=Denitratisoma oestradiolicum TaxID=311182 RepID=A0A6S6Y1S7_9PROT|nr:GspH/FimT family pseudopilin [Denitratisoma oestradiolicum]TWO79198.1 type II secretion system protein GspH [Denitratisoma oestradiolicum]CAB1370841.1 putative Type II secretion system protein GspH [Denitratisoma oestradiolicum]